MNKPERLQERVRISERYDVANFMSLHVVKKKLQSVSGQVREQFSIIVGNGHTSMVVAIDKDNKVLLIREFQGAVEEDQYGLPRGKVESNQTSEEAAQAELEEEAGVRANELVKLGVLTAIPGYVNLRTHIFLGTGLTPSNKDGDEMEKLEVKRFTFNEIITMIESGEINEARVISAILLARAKLGL